MQSKGRVSEGKCSRVSVSKSVSVCSGMSNTNQSKNTPCNAYHQQIV